jgi:hypothetical protein
VTLYLGPAGNLLAFPSPARDMQRDPVANIAQKVTLGGVNRTQRLGKTSRAFKANWVWLGESDYNALDDLMSGAYGPGPMILMDPGETNLLPVQAGTATTQQPGTTAPFNANTGTITSVASALSARGRAVQWVVPASSVLAADLNVGAGVNDLTPVRANTPYAASMYAWLASGTGFTAACELEWYDVAGAVIGSAVQGTGVALTTSPQRLTVTAAAPATAAYGQITLTNSVLTSGSLTVLTDRWQIREAPDNGLWTVGPSAVRVTLMSLSPRAQLQAGAPSSRHNVELELLEVG